MKTNQPQINQDNLNKVQWHISSFSDNQASCVEAGPLGDNSGRIVIRRSKRRNAEFVVYTKEEWRAFLTGVKAGEFEFEEG